MSAFDNAFDFTVGEEGVLSMDRNDPGNWSGGQVGVGSLNGTKYGISAAAFPHVAINSLTLAQAKVLAKPYYWDSLRCDELPPALAGLVFDCAFNQGVSRAAKTLQATLGIQVDGVVGAQTVAAAVAAQGNLQQVITDFCARRVLSYAQDSDWALDGHGWVVRVLQGLLRAVP